MLNTAVVFIGRSGNSIASIKALRLQPSGGIDALLDPQHVSMRTHTTTTTTITTTTTTQKVSSQRVDRILTWLCFGWSQADYYFYEEEEVASVVKDY